MPRCARFTLKLVGDFVPQCLENASGLSICRDVVCTGLQGHLQRGIVHFAISLKFRVQFA
jgi:hypothetical protein